MDRTSIWKKDFDIFIRQGHFKEAYDFIEKLQEESVNDYEEAYLLHLKGFSLNKLSSFLTTIDLFTPLLTDNLRETYPLLYLDILLDLTFAYFRAGNMDETFRCIQKSETTIKSLENTCNEINLLEKKSRLEKLFGMFYYYKGDYTSALTHFEKELEIAERIGESEALSIALSNLGSMLYALGEYVPALKYYHRSLKLQEKSVNISLATTATIYSNMSLIFEVQGELGLALNYQNKAIKIREKIGVLELAVSNHILGRIYHSKGKIDEALNFYHSAHEIALNSTEVSHSFSINILFLIQLLLENDMKEKIDPYLNYLKTTVDDLPDFRSGIISYKIVNALILKESSRLKDITKAQEILQSLIEEGDMTKYFALTVYINLCDILIFEFQSLKTPEIFTEIKNIVDQLLHVSDKHKSYNVLVQAYLLNSQLYLAEGNFKEAKDNIIKAQKTAEGKGLHQLAITASRFYDEMLIKASQIERLIKDRISLAERIEYTNLTKLIKQIVWKKVYDGESEPEKSLLFMILDSASNVLYTYKFLEEFNENMIDEIITITKSFDDQLNIERFSLHNYNVLIRGVTDLKFCYIFSGRSYTASLKLSILIDILKAFQDVKHRVSSDQVFSIQSKESLITKTICELYQQPEPDEKSGIIIELTEQDEKELSNSSLSQLPEKLLEFKMILNPVRLIILKMLYQNFQMSAADLRELVGISWGSWSSHIKALENAGIVESKREFVNTRPTVMISLKSEGENQYQRLKRMLETL